VRQKFRTGRPRFAARGGSRRLHRYYIIHALSTIIMNIIFEYVLYIYIYVRVSLRTKILECHTCYYDGTGRYNDMYMGTIARDYVPPPFVYRFERPSGTGLFSFFVLLYDTTIEYAYNKIVFSCISVGFGRADRRGYLLFVWIRHFPDDAVAVGDETFFLRVIQYVYCTLSCHERIT